MQIVRNLAGYTLGRSDLGAPCHVQEKGGGHGRRNARTLSTETKRRACQAVLQTAFMSRLANKIYDEMMDFAKYAFNKSHAAAYAVVSYQTAYLKYYYPVEYMAALMTSVIDNSGKGGRVHSHLPTDGNFHSSSRCEPGRIWIFCGWHQHSLRTVCYQEHWKTGDFRAGGRAKGKRSV